MTNVINAYITLLRAQDHLKLRACGKVLLENSLISSILKRDGDDKIKMEDLYPTHDENGISTIEQRVLSYLDHDMVFIPINIEHTHWYLAVVNAKEYEIQVLDSMGTIFGRQDLILTIKEMQKQIDIVSQHKNLKDHKWPNIQVSSWPVREIHFEQKMQTDGMLNTGLEKEDMTQFRTKLAAILLSSELNKRKGCLLVKVDDEAIGSPSDVEILQSPNSPCKRKKYHQTSAACSPDRAMDPFLLCGLSTFDMPMTKEDLTDMLCDYIMTINDAETLETIWVWSFQPYNVSVTVRQLQASLRMKQPMPKECFNIGVRFLAYSENKRLTSANVKVSKHYMDLRFCTTSESVELNVQELAKSLETWPYMKYDASSCRFVLMPWRKRGIFNLFVLDREKKVCLILLLFLIGVKICHTKRATGEKANERPIDVFHWKHILQSGIPIIEDRNLSVIVLQFMSAWNNGQLMPISTDGQRLRKNFVIDLLAYDGNSRLCMIPVSVREYLSRIGQKTLKDIVVNGLIYHALILTLLLDAYLFECGSKQYIAKPS